MDRLIAEVDDTLGTAVTRRWPRLNAVQPATIEQQEFRTVQNADGTISPVSIMFTPHAAVPIAAPTDLRQQAISDDNLLEQLRSVGLAPIVIDESTVFPASALREEV
jgi:hypothetical protein